MSLADLAELSLRRAGDRRERISACWSHLIFYFFSDRSGTD
jgi:hypothetical protein